MRVVRWVCINTTLGGREEWGMNSLHTTLGKSMNSLHTALGKRRSLNTVGSGCAEL